MLMTAGLGVMACTGVVRKQRRTASRSHTAVPQMRSERECSICCEKGEDKVGLQDRDILQLVKNKVSGSRAFNISNGRRTV